MQQIIAHEFNSVAPSNELKAKIVRDGAIVPTKFIFADEIVDFALGDETGMRVRGVTLLFTERRYIMELGLDENLEPVVPAQNEGGPLWDAMRIYCEDVVAYYNPYTNGHTVDEDIRPITQWDVVNEPTCLNCSGSTSILDNALKKYVKPEDPENNWGWPWPWYPQLTEDYVWAAFDYAALNADTGDQLILNETGGVEFQGTGVKARFEMIINFVKANTDELGGIGIQMHVPTFAFLKSDDGNVVLDPDQILGVKQALEDYANIFDDDPNKDAVIEITEMDLRISDPVVDSPEWNYLVNRIGDPLLWTNMSDADKQDLQGQLYRTLLNAYLSVPEVSGVTFWNFVDSYSWLNGRSSSAWPYAEEPTESYPLLLGDNPATTTTEEVFWRKPAYYGVREALENYFASAFTLRDSDGNELLRFVENGNVNLLKGHITTDADFSTLGLPNDGDSEFVVQTSSGETVAVLTSEGNLYLAGSVIEDATPVATGIALQIKDSAGNLASLIDSAGNLRLTGKVIESGLPYDPTSPGPKSLGTDYMPYTHEIGPR